MDSKIKSFDGTGNVKVFLEKGSIHSSLKGYEDEKCAENIASRLEGRAFDVYMRLGNEDKKNPDKVKEELLNEFERRKQEHIQAPRCDFESGGAKISKWGSMSDGTLRGYFVLK